MNQTENKCQRCIHGQRKIEKCNDCREHYLDRGELPFFKEAAVNRKMAAVKDSRLLKL